MKAPETTTMSAGVDARTETHLPEWYECRSSTDETTTFAEAIRELPRAIEMTVAYKNPHTDE